MTVATMKKQPKRSNSSCTYVSVKLDDQVLPLVKAAAALAHQTVQDWLSDLANAAASEQVGRNPITRREPPA